jgi:hypothetical protein
VSVIGAALLTVSTVAGEATVSALPAAGGEGAGVGTVIGAVEVGGNTVDATGTAVVAALGGDVVAVDAAGVGDDAERAAVTDPEELQPVAMTMPIAATSIPRRDLMTFSLLLRP